MIKFRCCYCNQSINSNNTDPCDVNIISNIDKSTELRVNQSFYCHVDCFGKTLHSDIQGYFIISDE